MQGDRVLNVQAQRLLTVDGKNEIIVSWLGQILGIPSIKGFNIYQSMGGKIFKKIGDLITIDSFKAENVELLQGVDYFYKVTFVDQNDIESDINKALKISLFSFDPDRGTIFDNLARATTYRGKWNIDNWGEDGVIWIRKRAGERCSLCFDDIGEISTNQNCPECKGTGYKGGYVRFDKKIAVQMADKRLTETGWGFEATWAPRLNIDSFPIIHSSDVIARQDNTRFILGMVNPVRLKNMLLQQTASLVEIQPDHVAYLLE